MKTSESALTLYLNAVDEVKRQRMALPPHAIAELNDGERENYARQLALLLLAGDGITADQQRLFDLLLAAMKIERPQADIVLMAQQIDADRLESFLTLLESRQLVSSFLVDALVLCRIGHPLNATQGQIIAELTQLLQVAQADISRLADVAGLILGLHQGESLPSNVNLQHLKLNSWREFLRRELTAEHLRNGAEYGYWTLNRPLRIDFAWSLHDAEIHFGPQGKLEISSAGDIMLENCRFTHPWMTFGGSNRHDLKLTRCEFSGRYAESEQRTALLVDEVTLYIKECVFETRQARAISLGKSSNSEILDTRFRHCGHPALVGGALASHGENLWVQRCEFSHCLARTAGGIRAKSLQLHDSRFNHCLASAWPQEKFNLKNEQDALTFANAAGGLFISNSQDISLNSCEFVSSSVKIDFKVSYFRDTVISCHFTDSAVSRSDIYHRITNGEHLMAQLPIMLPNPDDNTFSAAPWEYEY